MADPTAAGRLRTQAANVERLTSDLERIVAAAAGSAARLREAPEDLVLLMGGGGLLHGFYSTFERLLRDVADALNGHVPEGEAWHARLLDQMSADVPGVRPPLFPVALRERLDEYRAFRHVYRNLYVFNLRADRIETLLESLAPLWSELKPSLLAFAAALRATADAL